jgi:hypothetical protein
VADEDDTTRTRRQSIKNRANCKVFLQNVILDKKTKIKRKKKDKKEEKERKKTKLLEYGLQDIIKNP